MTPDPGVLELVRPTAAIESLTTDQRQLDMDGCHVGVSRQALDEVLAYIERLTPPAEARREVATQLRQIAIIADRYPLSELDVAKLRRAADMLEE